MKTFSTSGTENQQTLSEIESNNVPIYDSMADAEADLANLSVGQIIATKDTGDELSHPVNVVEEGNLHAVSSNAVAEVLNGYKIKAKTITGTTNPYGIIYRNNSTMTGNEKIIFAICSTDDICVRVGYHTANGIWLQVITYNNTPLANTSVSIDVIYLE